MFSSRGDAPHAVPTTRVQRLLSRPTGGGRLLWSKRRLVARPQLMRQGVNEGVKKTNAHGPKPAQARHFPQPRGAPRAQRRHQLARRGKARLHRRTIPHSSSRTTRPRIGVEESSSTHVDTTNFRRTTARARSSGRSPFVAAAPNQSALLRAGSDARAHQPACASSGSTRPGPGDGGVAFG